MATLAAMGWMYRSEEYQMWADTAHIDPLIYLLVKPKEKYGDAKTLLG